MISSPANARIKQVVQWQTRAKERQKDQVFVVEGLKLYGEAPRERIREVYVTTEFLERLRRQSERAVLDKLGETGFEEVTEEVFAKLSDTRTPQGILAVVEQPRYELNQLLLQENPLFLLLEDLQDPGNLGTILRTGEGAGITGVIMSASTVDIFNPKVIRATMGSVFRVPFLYADDLQITVDRLHEAGVKTYAAHLQGDVYYDSFGFCGPVAFMIGNEANGLGEALTARASARIKIPMEGMVESLNAGVAAALLMYEAHRQRSNAGFRTMQGHGIIR